MDGTGEAGSEVLFDQLQQLVTLADRGDVEAARQLSGLLDRMQAVQQDVAKLGRHAQDQWIQLISDGDRQQAELLTRRTEAMRRELMEGATAPLELLMVEEVVLRWLQVYHADGLCIETADSTKSHQRFQLEQQKRTKRWLLTAQRRRKSDRQLLHIATEGTEK